MIDRTLSPSADTVAFVSGAPGSPSLEIAPLDVGPTMAAGVWSRRTAILTSATVPRSLPERIGLPEPEVIDVGSPFDYGENSLLYCAMHLPAPNDPAFRAATHEELAALITAAGGRTLALFTSWAAMDEAAAALTGQVLTPSSPSVTSRNQPSSPPSPRMSRRVSLPLLDSSKGSTCPAAHSRSL